MYFDLGRLRDADRRTLVEIGLQRAALVDGDFVAHDVA
jgi:hypothetical protein